MSAVGMAMTHVWFAPPTLGIAEFVLFVQWKPWTLLAGRRRAARQVLSQKSNILIYFSACM